MGEKTCGVILHHDSTNKKIITFLEIPIGSFQLKRWIVCTEKTMEFRKKVIFFTSTTVQNNLNKFADLYITQFY